MYIDEEFMTRLEGLLGGARLTEKAHFWQTESAMRPVYVYLKWAYDTRVDLAPFQIKRLLGLLRAIPRDRQIKYSAAIKLIEKTVTGQKDKIFLALKDHAEKLSKSQQRYINPLLSADTGHGLCKHMALIWLSEKFHHPTATLFPRMAGENVVHSREAFALGEKAAGLTGTTAQMAKSLGLSLMDIRRASFDDFDRMYSGGATLAYLIAFYKAQHAIAIFREDRSHCQFYDANAGAYRIENANLRDFLLTYNNTCLRLKWTGYRAPATTEFDDVQGVSAIAVRATART
jgi:hypothetical protein